MEGLGANLMLQLSSQPPQQPIKNWAMAATLETNQDPSQSTRPAVWTSFLSCQAAVKYYWKSQESPLGSTRRNVQNPGFAVLNSFPAFATAHLSCEAISVLVVVQCKLALVLP